MSPTVIADSDGEDDSPDSPLATNDADQGGGRCSDTPIIDLTRTSESTDPSFFQTVFNEHFQAAMEPLQQQDSALPSEVDELGSEFFALGNQRSTDWSRTMPKDPWEVPSSPIEPNDMARNDVSHEDEQQAQHHEEEEEEADRGKKRRKLSHKGVFLQGSSDQVDLIQVPSQSQEEMGHEPPIPVPVPEPSSMHPPSLPLQSRPSLVVAPNPLTQAQRREYQSLALPSSLHSEDQGPSKPAEIGAFPFSSGSATNVNTPRSQFVSSRSQQNLVFEDVEPVTAPQLGLASNNTIPPIDERDELQNEVYQDSLETPVVDNVALDSLPAPPEDDNTGRDEDQGPGEQDRREMEDELATEYIFQQLPPSQREESRQEESRQEEPRQEEQHQEVPRQEMPQQEEYESDFEESYIKPKSAKKKRGRPKKENKKSEMPSGDPQTTTETASSGPVAKKKRGRPKKSDQPIVEAKTDQLDAPLLIEDSDADSPIKETKIIQPNEEIGDAQDVDRREETLVEEPLPTTTKKSKNKKTKKRPKETKKKEPEIQSETEKAIDEKEMAKPQPEERPEAQPERQPEEQPAEQPIKEASISTPTKIPLKPTDSKMGSGSTNRTTYRVGLSKKSRVAPLLKIVRKIN